MYGNDKIVKIFWVGSRMCLIIHLKNLSSIYPKGYHNGYVESKFRKDYDSYHNCSEEPTFSGSFDEVVGKYFIGFDTVHSHDTEESQSLEKVIDRTREFARDIIINEDEME